MYELVPGFDIEDIPEDIADTLYLQINGSNCICVDEDSKFGVGNYFSINWLDLDSSLAIRGDYVQM